MSKFIFLDIDGVLRPFIQYHPIRTKKEHLGSFLSRRYHDSRYQTIDEGTLQSVLYDFHKEAIHTLQEVIAITNASIILTSSWRIFHSIDDMNLLFRLHDLNYIIDKTPYLNSRKDEIQEYLNKHSEISSYVIIDDIPLEKAFPNHAITTKEYLKESDKQRILDILI